MKIILLAQYLTKKFENFEILHQQDDFHSFLDFSFLDQNPLPKKSFYFGNFKNDVRRFKKKFIEVY